MNPPPRPRSSLDERDALPLGVRAPGAALSPKAVGDRAPAPVEAGAHDGHDDDHDHRHDHDHGHEDGQAEQDGDGLGPLSRRGFLVASGFGFAGALVGCSRPPESHLSAPATASDEATPGRSVWYASTCLSCAAGCGTLVRCRDGRPVKIEGNPEHPISKGGLCAVGQASLLELYDSKRLLSARVAGKDATLAAADARIVEGLASAKAAGTALRLVSGTITSRTTKAAIDDFVAGFPGARHVVYDASSASALLDAHARTRGARMAPRIHLERTETIVAIDADFLGTGMSPVEHARGRSEARRTTGAASGFALHVQIESAMTLSGTNADRRHRVDAGRVPDVVAHLVRRIADRTADRPEAKAAPRPEGEPPIDAATLDALAERLVATRGRSVILCGTNDRDVQALVALGNELIGAYERVLDVAAPSRQRAGDDAAFAALVDEMEAGRVGALMVVGCDPVVETPAGRRFAAALAKVALRVGLAERPSATTVGLDVLIPLPHALESWDDTEAVTGVVSLTQPAIGPFGASRSVRGSIAAWTGASAAPATEFDLLHDAWGRVYHPRQSAFALPDASWRHALTKGFVTLADAATTPPPFAAAELPAVAPKGSIAAKGRMSLALHATVGMLDGRHAHNPWLHELPDPVTKQAWGNAAGLSPAAADALGVEDGERIRIVADDGVAVVLPVLIQPGLADRTVSVALGYGRLGTDRFADVGPAWIQAKPTVGVGGVVGVDASPLLRLIGGAVSYGGREVTIERAGGTDVVARSQAYHSLDLPKNTAPHGAERREAVLETTPAALARKEPLEREVHPKGERLWGDVPKTTGVRFAMAIDLSACTGCSACVVACQAENNIPVVGRDEVARRRDMAWMRIDRYYADVPGAPGEVETVHQPMLCQHCGNAPCETVCPVLATVHSEDGLNAQVYNRCVGTRYCANNCPYKVRRFNWFEYGRPDPWADLALNPDVTVRSRGVMEKCSFCVQRIHEARAEAVREGRPVADGEIKTACQQSCPVTAITFGDGNDPKSAIAALAKDPRRYRVLEELGVEPAVSYLAKVRERPEGQPEARHD